MRTVQKKNNDVASQKANQRNVPASVGAQSCNLNFDSLAKNLKLDTPISLANCNKNTAEYIQGIEKLKKACRTKGNLLVLRADNKTVAYHRVEEPKSENDSFTCNSKDWFPLKEEYRHDGHPSTEWAVEAEPQDCSTTCAQIKPYTKIDKEYNDGRPFPGNLQCIKACENEALASCKKVIGTMYGDKRVTGIRSLNYRLDEHNVLRYNCPYSYN